MKRLLFVVLLSGCASARITHLPDGSEGYSISCDGAAVGINVCFEKAGALCGAKGYDLISRDGQVVPFGFGSASYSGGYYGQGNAFVTQGAFYNKSILVRCRS